MKALMPCACFSFSGPAGLPAAQLLLPALLPRPGPTLLLPWPRTPAASPQHNAAFALYGLSDNEDNLLEFVREGAVQRINECELVVQASRDCVNKLMKRLQVGGEGSAWGGACELWGCWWALLAKVGLGGEVHGGHLQARPQ